MTVVMPVKYLNILALSAIVFVACSFLPTPVTALSIDSNGLHARHAHIGQAFAKRASKRCRAGPPSPAGANPTTSPSTPAVTPANSPNTPATTPATTPPAPAPSPNYSGQKAGLALANWDLATRAAVLKNFKLRRVSTIYDWSPNKVDGAEAAGYKAVRMLSGPGNIDFWTQNVENTPGSTSYALGFNEPDHAQQANLSPWGAIDLWKTHMLPLRISNPGVTLVSPAVTSAASGETWFDEFNNNCINCFDAIAVHWYGTDAKEFTNYLQHWFDKYQKPLWVTEFACHSFAGGGPCPDVIQFARAVRDFMDKADFVVQYFPFALGDLHDVNPINQLLDNGNPTQLALTYFEEPAQS